MANTYEYTLSGDPAAGQQLVFDALARAGHRIEPQPDGTFNIERGSASATFWLGAWANNNFHTRYQLFFRPDPTGMIASFTRNGSHGALKGGAIGYATTERVFNDAAATIDAATRQAGILVSVAQRD